MWWPGTALRPLQQCWSHSTFCNFVSFHMRSWMVECLKRLLWWRYVYVDPPHRISPILWFKYREVYLEAAEWKSKYDAERSDRMDPDLKSIFRGLNLILSITGFKLLHLDAISPRSLFPSHQATMQFVNLTSPKRLRHSWLCFYLQFSLKILKIIWGKKNLVWFQTFWCLVALWPFHFNLLWHCFTFSLIVSL